MVIRTNFRAQLLSSRIAVASFLAICIFVSETEATSETVLRQVREIKGEDGHGLIFDYIEDQGPENFPTDESSSSFPDEIFCSSRDTTSSDQGEYTHTPGVGIHKIYTTAKTWTEARSICRSEGGDLAIVNSHAEYKALADFIADSQPHVGSDDPPYVHIGFHDVNHEGNYVTVDGKPLNETGFGKWATREPNDGGHFGNEDCGSLYKDGNLNDVSCLKKLAFICELPILLDVKDFQPGPVDPRYTSGSKGINAGLKGSDVPNGAGDSRRFVGVTKLFLCTFCLHFASSYSKNF